MPETPAEQQERIKSDIRSILYRYGWSNIGNRDVEDGTVLEMKRHLGQARDYIEVKIPS